MKRGIFLAIILTALVAVLYNDQIYSLSTELNKPIKSSSQDLYSNLEILSDVIVLIQEEYVETEQPKDIIYGALQGMLEALDSYSQFLEPDVYQELKVETEGEFGGIGIVIAVKTGILTIISPLEGTPGHEAGLEAGDRVVQINGESTKGITLMEAVKKLRGKPKTEVTLTVLRESEQRLIQFKIIRDIVKIESVKESKVINNNIGYIKILEFQENTLPDFKKALSSLKDSNIEGLIVDLRNNPGGLLDIAVAVTSEFLPKGSLVVYTEGRNSKQDMKFHSKGGGFLRKPMIVLINKGSASGSEIFAGAIKDNNRGLIVGQTSFGKASVQTIIPLKDDSAIRLTTAHYYTPSGHLIHEKGVEPDVEIDLKKVQAVSKDIITEFDTDTMFENIERGEEYLSLEEKKEEKRDFELEQAVDIMKGLIKYSKMLSES